MTDFQLACITDYEQQLRLAGFSESELKKKIADEMELFEQAAFFGNETGGCLYYNRNGKAFLFYIMVYQKGIGNGKILLKQFEEVMKEKGVTSIQLNVFEHNVTAHKLYRDYFIISSLMEKKL